MFRKINRIDSFSPYFFMPFIIVIYFSAGMFDFYRFDYFNVQSNILPVILAGLVVYYIAVFIADKGDWVFPRIKLGFLQGKTRYGLYILGTIGLIAYLMMLFNGQIGILDESIRRNINPKLKFFSSLLWFSALLLLCTYFLERNKVTFKRTLIYGILFLGIISMFVLLGYRTPILIMMMTAIMVYHYGIKRIKIGWFLAVLIILGILLSLFGLYRFVTEDNTEEFNSREGPKVELDKQQEERIAYYKERMNEVPFLVRRINVEMVTSHIVLSKIMEYTEQEGYLKGKLHENIFLNILPGEQVSPRTLITEMVNSISVKEGVYITRPGRTTVPTFFGQLFADGGYILVMIGFALYGFIVSMLYNQMKRNGKRSYQTVAYTFITTVFTISIHTGLLDLILILMIGYVVLSASIEKLNTEQKNGTPSY